MKLPNSIDTFTHTYPYTYKHNPNQPEDDPAA